MAAHPNHPILNLNLLYPQGIPQKLPIKLLKWVLTFGRYIAIGVEIIVLATFAARFKLDADLATIKEDINKQIPFIQNLAETETKIKQLQNKISTIKKTTSASTNWKKFLDQIAAQTPQGVVISNLSLDNSSKPLQYKIIGTATTNNELSVFVAGLKSEKNLSNVNLATLSYDQGQVAFTITGSTK